ncbi:MAG: TIGR04255 family protein, partial [Cyclobacteriaceae bacterium]|nr:TIGR04255 family protein [Cyclobacteriaceae bacterium]
MSTTLEFSNAPVIEVILGSQFEGVTFESKSIFDFYNSVKENFPDIQENPPLAALIENIDSPSETRIISGFTSRKFFINNSQNKLIQIQPDRFLFNWRKTNNEEEYPHFDSVFSE